LNEEYRQVVNEVFDENNIGGEYVEFTEFVDHFAEKHIKVD
jgi:hypothetical protein